MQYCLWMMNDNPNNNKRKEGRRKRGGGERECVEGTAGCVPATQLPTAWLAYAPKNNTKIVFI